MKKLTPQQWRLYDFLKSLMENENNRTTTVKEIAQKFPEEYKLRESENNFSNCPRIYEDLKAITNSFEVDLIVCLNHNKIRLGTELDILKRLHSLTNRIKWEAEEVRAIKNKIKQHRQYKLVTNAGVPVQESPSAKAWHVAFSDDNIAQTIKELTDEDKRNRKTTN